jgi:hypothetical protein
VYDSLFEESHVMSNDDIHTMFYVHTVHDIASRFLNHLC